MKVTLTDKSGAVVVFDGDVLVFPRPEPLPRFERAALRFEQAIGQPDWTAHFVSVKVPARLVGAVSLADAVGLPGTRRGGRRNRRRYDL